MAIHVSCMVFNSTCTWSYCVFTAQYGNKSSSCGHYTLWSTSDKNLVKMTGIVDRFEPGDICMADCGFNIQELFLHKQVCLVIPPFTRTTKSTSQFTKSEDTKTKTVANARIHIELAIGRLKD